MPLITCAECGRESVSLTGLCPTCSKRPRGYPCQQCGRATSTTGALCKGCAAERTERQRAEQIEWERCRSEILAEFRIAVTATNCRVCGQGIGDCGWESMKPRTAIETVDSDMRHSPPEREAGFFAQIFRPSYGPGEKRVPQFPIKPEFEWERIAIRCRSCGEENSWAYCPWCRTVCRQPNAWKCQSVLG